MSVPCLIDCRGHVRLPLVVTVSLPRWVFLAGAGTRVLEAARQRKQQLLLSLCRRRSGRDSHVTCHLSGMYSHHVDQ